MSIRNLLPLLALAAAAQAAVTGVGTKAAPFLGIGLGSRALGMGGAFTSLADDGSCLYWNPAGAALLGRSEMLVAKTDWLVDTDLSFVALIAPLGDRAAVGMSITYLDYGDMEVTTLAQQDGTGEFFSSSDFALGLTWAMRLTDRFSFGASGKFIQQKIWQERASSVAFDVGTLYRTGFRSMTLGMGIYHVGLDMGMDGTDLLIGHDLDPNIGGDNPANPARLDTYDWELPIAFRIGASLPLMESPLHRWLLSVDAVHAADRSEAVSLGSEFGYRERFFLRGGWRDLFLDEVEGGLALGAGFRYPLAGGSELRIDAAWEDYGRLDSTVRYSLALTW
jgi:hypothetical protein